MSKKPPITESDLPPARYRVTSARRYYGRLIVSLATVGRSPVKRFSVNAAVSKPTSPFLSLFRHPIVDLAFEAKLDDPPVRYWRARDFSDADLKILSGLTFRWSSGCCRDIRYEADKDVQRFVELFCRWADRSHVAIKEDRPGATWTYRGKQRDSGKRHQFTLRNIEAHLDQKRWYALRASQTMFSQIDIDQHDRSEGAFTALVADILNALPGHSFLTRTPRGLRVFVRWTRPQSVETVSQYFVRRLARWQIDSVRADGKPAYEVYPQRQRASRLPFGKDQPVVAFDRINHVFSVVSSDWRKSLDIAESAPAFSVQSYFSRADRKLPQNPSKSASVAPATTPDSSVIATTPLSTSSTPSSAHPPSYSGKDTKRWLELFAGWIQRQHPEWAIDDKLHRLHALGVQQRPTSRTIANLAEFDRVARPIVERMEQSYVPPFKLLSSASFVAKVGTGEYSVSEIVSILRSRGDDNRLSSIYANYLHHRPAFAKRRPHPPTLEALARLIVRIVNAIGGETGPVPRDFLVKLPECRDKQLAGLLASFFAEAKIFVLTGWSHNPLDPSLSRCRIWTLHPSFFPSPVV